MLNPFNIISLATLELLAICAFVNLCGFNPGFYFGLICAIIMTSVVYFE